MEQVASERTTWVARTLAIICGVFAVRIAYGLIKYLFGSDAVFSFWGLIVIVLGTSLCSFVFWLAVRLWTKLEAAHIRLFAAIPALIIAAHLMNLIRQALIEISEFNELNTAQIALFISFLVAGICYLLVKRVLFRLLNTSEDIDRINFRQSRIAYFNLLSVLFWLVLMSASMYFDNKYIDVHDSRFFWFPFASLLLPIAAAMLFYKICILLFVTMPLRNIQEKSKNL